MKAIVCLAPDVCAPCSMKNHKDCSFDGEPKCLCKKCSKKHKRKNRRKFNEDVQEAIESGDYEPPTPEEREELDRLGSSNA